MSQQFFWFMDAEDVGPCQAVSKVWKELSDEFLGEVARMLEEQEVDLPDGSRVTAYRLPLGADGWARVDTRCYIREHPDASRPTAYLCRRNLYPDSTFLDPPPPP